MLSGGEFEGYCDSTGFSIELSSFASRHWFRIYTFSNVQRSAPLSNKLLLNKSIFPDHFVGIGK